MSAEVPPGFGGAPSWTHRASSVDPTGMLDGRWRWAIGLVAICGGLLGQTSLLMPDVLIPGTPSAIYSLVLLAMSLSGVGLLLMPSWVSFWIPCMVLIGNACVGAASLAATDPTRFSSRMMLMLPMLFTACLLSRWLFAVQCALILPVLMLTPADVYRSHQEWAAQLLWNAFALVLTGAAILAIRHQAERALVRSLELSNTDPLTGLANRRFLLDQADSFVATASRLDQEVAALVLDLDHFKSVNDDYGHAVGDTVLVTVADALRKVVRVNDIAARTGGEEILVLAYVDDAAHADSLADRLHVTVGGLSIGVGDRVVQPKCSIGVAVTRPGQMDGPEALWALIADADTALFAAKREGRNRWRRARRPDEFAPELSDRI